MLQLTRDRLRRHEPLCVVCYGDSVSEVGRTPGYSGGASAAAAHWGTLLETDLRRRLETAAVQVKHFGIGGQNAYEGLGRLDWLAALEPHLVLLEFGLNDCGYHPLPPECTRLALRSLVEGVRGRYGADVVIVAAGGDNPLAPRLSGWDETYGVLRAVARECGVPLADVRSAMLQATDGGRRWAQFHQNEYDVHPNDAGHAVWAAVVLDTVTAAL